MPQSVIEDRSIRIWQENLAVVDENGRAPLSALAPDDHIHGGLRIQLGGRIVPYLGYFGPDDVCFNTWLAELWSAASAFESATNACHTFDEGEQGQPAFVFERVGDKAFFSIRASECSGAEGDVNWERVEFSPAEFLAEHERFRESFFATIRTEAPNIADQWIRANDPGIRGS